MVIYLGHSKLIKLFLKFCVYCLNFCMFVYIVWVSVCLGILFGFVYIVQLLLEVRSVLEQNLMPVQLLSLKHSL